MSVVCVVNMCLWCVSMCLWCVSVWCVSVCVCLWCVSVCVCVVWRPEERPELLGESKENLKCKLVWWGGGLQFSKQLSAQVTSR